LPCPTGLQLDFYKTLAALRCSSRKVNEISSSYALFLYTS
jgi:hypothetical protein